MITAINYAPLESYHSQLSYDKPNENPITQRNDHFSPI